MEKLPDKVTKLEIIHRSEWSDLDYMDYYLDKIVEIAADYSACNEESHELQQLWLKTLEAKWWWESWFNGD